MLKTANFISYGLEAYLLIGLVFGLYFITRGIRNEPIEGKAPILRLMLLPAAILIWPILIGKRS
jgi:hypothetical protein